MSFHAVDYAELSSLSFAGCRRFTACKLHSIDSSQDADVILRTIAGQKLNKILLREYRPHLMASSATYEPCSPEQVIQHIEHNQCLRCNCYQQCDMPLIQL